MRMVMYRQSVAIRNDIASRSIFMGMTFHWAASIAALSVSADGWR